MTVDEDGNSFGTREEIRALFDSGESIAAEFNERTHEIVSVTMPLSFYRDK